MALPKVKPGEVLWGPSKVFGLGIVRWVADDVGPLNHGELLMKSGKWMPDDSFDASEVAKGMPVEVPSRPTTRRRRSE